MALTVCVTAFNEAGNIEGLAADLDFAMRLSTDSRAVIIDNGSADHTWELLQKYFSGDSRITIHKLEENHGYGGGLRAAVELAQTDYVLLLSADRQYTPRDLQAAISVHDRLDYPVFLIGKRVKRYDPFQARMVSKGYSLLMRMILGIPILDVNSQPKILPKTLLKSNAYRLSDSFFLDAQLVSLAMKEKLTFVEINVEFLNRRVGVSSWSGRRFRTYLSTIRAALAWRREIRK